MKNFLKVIGFAAFGIVVLACLAANFGFDQTKDDEILLRFTVWDGDASLAAIKEAVAEFEEANPGIKVRVENFADYNLYHQKMLTQYAANVAPDVAMMDPQHFQALARRGAIMNLSELMAETPSFNIDEYYKPIVDAHSWQGNVYVLPRDIAPMGLIYYNKRIFDEAGMPYPDGTWTWDFEVRPELREKDFLWVMQQLTEHMNENSDQRRWAFAPDWAGFFTDSVAYQTGLEWADDYEEPTEVLFGGEGWTRVFQFYEDLTLDKKFMPSQNDVTNVVQSTTQMMFVNEKVAMYQCGIWQVPNMRKFLVPGEEGFFEWDIAKFPAHVNGSQKTASGGSGYSIFSSTEHPEEAWKLVQWMAGEPAMIKLAEMGTAMPAIESLALSDAWLPGPDTPLESRYPENRIITHELVNESKFPPNSDLWPEVGGIISGRVSAIYTGTTPPEEAVQLGADEANRRLDTLRQEEDLTPFPWGLGAVIAGLIMGAIGWGVYGKESRTKLSTRQKSDTKSAYWFLAPWIFGLLVFTLGPMILSLLMSFADWDIIQPAKFRGLGNYAEAFSVDPRFWKSLWVTMVYTVFSVPVGIAFAMLLAMLLNQKVRGMPVFRAMYYLPSLASLVAASLIWRRIFSPEEGLLNAVIYGPKGDWDFLGIASWLSAVAGNPENPVNWLGSEITALPAMIIMSFWGVGAPMVILLAGLQGIPQVYYEAATVDGATPWHKFKAVTLPLLTPAIFFTMITGLIGSFQTFAQSLVMTDGGPNDATLFFMLHLYNQAFESLRMGYASALAWVLFVIILIFTLVQFRMSKWVYYETDNK